MTQRLRRGAMLQFPDVSFNDTMLDQLVTEGFDDLVLFPVDEGVAAKQGYSLECAMAFAERAHARGLGIAVVTGYMKYEENLIACEPQRMMVLRGPGMTLDSDDLISKWLCPFRPENKQRYINHLRVITKIPGLRDLYLNDEAFLGYADGTIGCYCDYCRAVFCDQTGVEPPVLPDWNDPLWWRWLDHRMAQWTAVHAEFREQVHQWQPQIRVGFQHSPVAPCRCWQPWKMAISLAADARAMDVMATDPYHFNHHNIIKYRPHRRILAEATRSIVGACVNERVAIIPQGFMPTKQAAPMGRADGLLAGIVPFALGAHNVTPYTDELMRIIPGFAEGFNDAQRLMEHFETHRPYAFATMLSPLQSEVRGHPESNWGDSYINQAAELMYHTGVPWRWLWDQRLDDVAGTLTGPLIVPDAHCLTESQRRVIDHAGGVLWIGNTPASSWDGRSMCKLPTPFGLGRFVVEMADGSEPVVLMSRAGKPPFDGEVVGRIEGEPAVVLGENEAWITGMPMAFDSPPDKTGTRPCGNLDFIRHLLVKLASHQPQMRMEPWPPMDAYRTIRPEDRRNLPPGELLPMVSDNSLLAIIFSYTPIAFEAELVVDLPVGRSIRSVRDVWHDRTIEMSGNRLPITMDGSCEPVALRFDFVN